MHAQYYLKGIQIVSPYNNPKIGVGENNDMLVAEWRKCWEQG